MSSSLWLSDPIDPHMKVKSKAVYFHILTIFDIDVLIEKPP